MSGKNLAEWHTRDREDHAVYIMGHLIGGVVSGLTKVGISKSPESRLKQIQAVEPGVIVLVAQFWCWKRSHALMLERSFHKACVNFRVRGEWFDVEPFHAVGIMSENLKSFVDDFIGHDDTSDFYSAYHHLNVPGFAQLVEMEPFRFTR